MISKDSKIFLAGHNGMLVSSILRVGAGLDLSLGPYIK